MVGVEGKIAVFAFQGEGSNFNQWGQMPVYIYMCTLYTLTLMSYAETRQSG